MGVMVEHTQRGPDPSCRRQNAILLQRSYGPQHQLYNTVVDWEGVTSHFNFVLQPKGGIARVPSLLMLNTRPPSLVAAIAL